MVILHELTDGPGYCLDELTPAELVFVRGRITDQYLGRLAELQPGLVEPARAAGIAGYHTLPIAFDHTSAWPKETRLLPARHVADFARMGFFRRIRRQLGPGAVISHDELNWRLVRPGLPEDVGPVHLDRWFWDGGYGTMPEGYDRFKVWIAVHTEPGANGLAVLPHSQRRSDWKHHFEVRDGVRKPVLDEDPDALGMGLLPLGPGGLVMFHDELLHGGVVNRGATCRVSIELTVLFPRAEGQARAARLIRRGGGVGRAVAGAAVAGPRTEG
jgi:hypothetical protein